MKVQLSAQNQYKPNYYEKISTTRDSSEVSKSKMDSYEPSNDISLGSNYSKNSIQKNLSQSLLDSINENISKIQKYGDTYYYRDISFKSRQIPSVDITKLSEKKAINNILDFGKNTYFKYVANDGKQYSLYAQNGAIGTIFTELLRGESYDVVREKYIAFWNQLMNNDPVYLGLSYSDDEVRKYLDEAGIKNGIFSVKMGDREAEQYYTASKNMSPVQARWKYDIFYKDITSDGNVLKNYEPGSVFRIGDTDYTLSENHTLNISYGEDIFDMQFPSNYKFGQKIEE